MPHVELWLVLLAEVAEEALACLLLWWYSLKGSKCLANRLRQQLKMTDSCQL